MAKAKKFVLVSIYHTKSDDEFLYLWRGNNAGYCKNLTDAGIYSHIPEETETQYQPDGYHNTMRTLPVEVGGHEYEKLQMEYSTDGDYIYNNSFNRHVLGLSVDGLGLKRGK